MSSKKVCRENFNTFIKWNDKKYKLVKTFSTGRSSSAFRGSGAYVYLIEDKKTKKKYILKYFNKESSRNKREIYILCRCSGIQGVPVLYRFGRTTLSKTYGEKLKENKLFYISSIVDGEQIDEMNIIFKKKKDVLYVSLEILKILQRIREKVGKDFEHYDLHPGNILVDKKKSPPTVSIIDFDNVNVKELDFLSPETTSWANKKKGYLRFVFMDEKIIPPVFNFMFKWYKGLGKILTILWKEKRISNTDIWNWYLISMVLFDKNNITKKLISCEDIEDCIQKNFPKYVS